MTDGAGSRATEFRRLHDGATPLLLPNAWDAGSARMIEACGAGAIATTSAGLAWSRGYPDGKTTADYTELNALFSATRGATTND
jgi:2-methylisocitrate lyase-like PEP mutase family enzyme